jgi:hypothetical protein
VTQLLQPIHFSGFTLIRLKWKLLSSTTYSNAPSVGQNMRQIGVPAHPVQLSLISATMRFLAM